MAQAVTSFAPVFATYANLPEGPSGRRRREDPINQRRCHEGGGKRHDHHHGEKRRGENVQVESYTEDDELDQSPGVEQDSHRQRLAPRHPACMHDHSTYQELASYGHHYDDAAEQPEFDAVQ